LVGVTGFEPVTTAPPERCATRLRYTPINTEEYILISEDRNWVFYKLVIPYSSSYALLQASSSQQATQANFHLHQR
jgi:hypothetical protein